MNTQKPKPHFSTKATVKKKLYSFPFPFPQLPQQLSKQCIVKNKRKHLSTKKPQRVPGSECTLELKTKKDQNFRKCTSCYINKTRCVVYL
jgi:hypothetical protein